MKLSGVPFPKRLSRLLSLEKIVDWTEGYQIALDLRQCGLIHEAIYATLVVLKRFSSNLDAQGWGFYHLFQFIAEDQSIEIALQHLLTPFSEARRMFLSAPPAL